MQRRQPDANSHPLHAAGASGPDAVDVVVLSTDEALLRTLQEAASATHTIWHAPTADAAVDLLLGGHCGILIADLSVLRSDAAALLEKLLAQFPEMVLLATGRRDQEGAVAALLTRGSIYRFLHKPVSPARADLFLATATRRYHEIASTPSPALAGVRQLTKPSNRLALIGGCAILALLALAALMFFTRSPSRPAAAPATVAADATRSSLDAQLAAAKAAFDAGRFVEPAEDNALARYRAVLAIDAGNATANAGVQQIRTALRAEVSTALQARDTPAAARALKRLQDAQPDDPQLGELRDQLFALSRTVSSGPVVPSAPAASRAATATTAAAALTNNDLARRRLAEGQLLAPDGDNALFFLRQARSQAEDDSTTRILATDLGSQLLEQTRRAVAAGQLAEARARYVTAADVDREFELTLPDLAATDRQIADLEANAAQAANAAIVDELAPAIQLRESGQLIEPAAGNAFDSLRAIASRHPDSPEVRTEVQRLAFTLVEHSRTAVAEGDLERAEWLAAHADELVPGMNTVQTLRQQIASARARRDAAATSVMVNAGSLQRVGGDTPVYPVDARRRGQEGWVDLEFTIGADGTTRDIQIRESRPGSVFNRAAIDALRTWRYQPVERNGQRVEQRAQLRMQFTLQ